MKFRYPLFLLSIVIFISGCSATIDDYADEQPPLYLEAFFSGQLEAHGIVQDRSGKVTRRFSADIVGTWAGEQGVLDENFTFADGELQHRCWRLNKLDNAYLGTAGDVVGEAKGQVRGNALNWQYTLQIPVDGNVWNIQLNDWMYLVDENNLINRAVMTKFGVTVGEITLFIKRVSDKPLRSATQGCAV